jgi:nitrogen regulatory protein P-II 1
LDPFPRVERKGRNTLKQSGRPFSKGGPEELRKVNDILRSRLLEDVEERLKKIGIKGLTATRVKGYGENKSIGSQDWLGTHARIEIFTEKSTAEKIATLFMEVAPTGGPGDGILCIFPIEKVLRIRTKSEGRPEET